MNLKVTSVQDQTFFNFDESEQNGKNKHACARLARTRKASGACPASLVLRVYFPLLLSLDEIRD